jgi:uncharacterized membrane protein YcaP (DUF421 family)
MWFNGWESVGRIVVFAITAYVIVTALIRVLGKRTISQMNPSDFVMTVAVGSIVASWILPANVSFVDGLAAATTMLALKMLTELVKTRSRPLRKIIDGAPTLLAYHGRFLHEVMTRENVSEEEVLEGLRQQGVAKLEDAAAVVLEINGDVSVLPKA